MSRWRREQSLEDSLHLEDARNKYGEEVLLHGPVCSECQQRVGRAVPHLETKERAIVCVHCWDILPPWGGGR